MAKDKMTLTEMTLHLGSCAFITVIMARPTDSYLVAGLACGCFFSATVAEAIRKYSLLGRQSLPTKAKKKKARKH